MRLFLNRGGSLVDYVPRGRPFQVSRGGYLRRIGLCGDNHQRVYAEDVGLFESQYRPARPSKVGVRYERWFLE